MTTLPVSSLKRPVAAGLFYFSCVFLFVGTRNPHRVASCLPFWYLRDNEFSITNDDLFFRKKLTHILQYVKRFSGII